MLNKLICFVFGHITYENYGMSYYIKNKKVCPRCGKKLK